MLKKVILIALLIFASYNFIQAQTLQQGDAAQVKISSERLQRIDKMIQQYIDSGFIKGAVAFISRDGKIVYDKAFGLNKTDENIAMKTDNIFRIASQTKAITSVALMTLFEQGKFLLDDPVSKYIPSFAHPKVLDKFNAADTTYTTVDAKREVTIRDLLTHTSGIDYAGIGSDEMRAIYAKNNIPSGLGSNSYRLEETIPKLGTLPLKHQPGERFTYGLNTDVIGYLVEVLSGEQLDAYMRKHIFDPLGMSDTYFYLPAVKAARLVQVNTEDKEHHAVKWDDATSNIKSDYPAKSGTYFSGGAGLVSTVKDYAIFLQMLLNDGMYNGQRILSRHTVELMTTNQIGDLNLGVDKFGLGFEITTKAGQAKVGVSEGSFAWGGFFGTTYWADPKERLVCLIYAQQNPLSHGEIADKFRALVYQSLND